MFRTNPRALHDFNTPICICSMDIHIYTYIYIPQTLRKIPPGGFLAITRYQGAGEVQGQVDMLPTSFPDLPKPSRTPGKGQKTMLSNSDIVHRTYRTVMISLTYPFKGPYQGGSLFTAYCTYVRACPSVKFSLDSRGSNTHVAGRYLCLRLVHRRYIFILLILYYACAFVCFCFIMFSYVHVLGWVSLFYLLFLFLVVVGCLGLGLVCCVLVLLFGFHNKTWHADEPTFIC